MIRSTDNSINAHVIDYWINIDLLKAQPILLELWHFYKTPTSIRKKVNAGHVWACVDL